MPYAAIAAATALSSIALATDFPVDKGSIAEVEGLTSIDLIGTLVGDWDEETNPDGTRTIPGLWGGSGNTAIPMEMVFNIPLSFNGNCLGGMSIDIAAPELCIMQNIEWDLLGGGDASAALSMTVQYESFHTEQPTAIFIGGFPIEIPLNESPITQAQFQQLAIAVGTSVELPDQPGVFEIQAAVGGLLHLTVDMLGTPIPMQLPVAGMIEGTYAYGAQSESVHLTGTFSIDETFDLPAEPLPTIPMELPTILPPGSIASVLLDLALQTVAVQAAIDVAIDGHVYIDTTPGDATGDGLVNTDDILAVLSQWGPCEGCGADLNGDGTVGVDDILIIIEHWS
jgi:hypothetical protein